ncbi:MAG: AAA family ATPase [Trueperaceae bacterium]
MVTSAVLLQEVRLPSPSGHFPFSLPLLRNSGAIALDRPVTVLVGENGSGKSTLLEAIALACELPVVGSVESSAADSSLDAVRPLADALKLTWSRRTRRGLFLRAEDYFGYVTAQNRMKAEMRGELERLRRENPTLPELELRRISSPFAGSLAATEQRYGGDLDARSHGESFLALFKGRLTGEGLYVLDEPEAALSPLRQLAFMALLKDAVARGAQFLIATHAPMLMAFPGARLYEVRDEEIVRAEYDELEHVRTMRDFLAAPEAFLRHL